MKKSQIFISYSGHDSFEASLLQYALETSLGEDNVVAWTFQRDQAKSQTGIAKSLKDRVRESSASIFLLSPTTLNGGANQWMELAYADAYEVTTFVLLHHLDFQKLKEQQQGVPPLLLASQCNAANEWKTIIGEIRTRIPGERAS